MTTRTRWMATVAALLLASAYWLPLWRVDLIAPQYPEGLGMLIRIDGVEGLKENDLNSINGLNHYIGMKAIVPDAIPELRWMPWILAGLVAGGIAVAVSGRRRALYAWAAALMLLLGAGLFDYWRWGYDYGHDIDRDHAIIKIPGMTYSPPLIGRKKLLNFTATSWPAAGGMAMGLAAALALAAVLQAARDATRRAGSSAGGGRRERAPRVAVALALAVAASACAPPGPRDLVMGEDECEYCRMGIAEPRFASQVVSATGRQHLFDSVECMAGYLRGAAGGRDATAWVADAERPGEWVLASAAGYLMDGALKGEMGRIAAFASPAAATVAQQRLGGTVVTLAAILADSGKAMLPETH